jgi:hypothetical protein
MKEELLVSLHTLIMLGAWSSPFWLDWKIVFISLFLYEIQIFVFKGCILTNLQFSKGIRRESDMTMYAYWAEKLGFKVNRKKLKQSSKYFMPAIIFILTILYQLILKAPIWIKI